MKRLALWCIGLLIVGVEVGNFVTAPYTVQGVFLAKVGQQIVANRLQVTFDREGVDAVDSLCKSQVLTVLGHHHACFVSEGRRYGTGKTFKMVDVFIQTYSNEGDAEDTIGQAYFDYSRGDVVYAGSSGQSAYQPAMVKMRVYHSGMLYRTHNLLLREITGDSKS